MSNAEFSKDAVMICVRRREGLVPVPGSVHTTCSKCGTGLWIAGDMLFEYPHAKPVCLKCELPVIQAALLDPGTDIECPQPEAAPILEAIRLGLIDPELY